MPQVFSNGTFRTREQEVPDLLQDGVDEAEEESEEEIDFHWDDGDSTVDTLHSMPEQAFYGFASLLLSMEGVSFRVFLRFLPVDPIQTVVIPAINHHAATVFWGEAMNLANLLLLRFLENTE